MSRTISLNTDPDKREERIARRAQLRDLAFAARLQLAQWRQDRATAAEKRNEERRKELQSQPRGVDRVPAHLQVVRPEPTPVLYGKRDVDQVRPLAQPEDLHPAGDHATRRARGQRGHQLPSGGRAGRPTRRRDMPGAVARRLDRRRKAALAAAEAAAAEQA